jgi:hypothetical protein
MSAHSGVGASQKPDDRAPPATAVRVLHSVRMFDPDRVEPKTSLAVPLQAGGARSNTVREHSVGASGAAWDHATTTQIGSALATKPAVRSPAARGRDGFWHLCSPELASSLSSAPARSAGRAAPACPSAMLAALLGARVHSSSGWHVGRLTDVTEPKCSPNLLPPRIDAHDECGSPVSRASRAASTASTEIHLGESVEGSDSGASSKQPLPQDDAVHGWAREPTGNSVFSRVKMFSRPR